MSVSLSFQSLASTVSTAPIIAKRSSVRSERRQSMRAELPENGKRVKKHNAPLMSTVSAFGKI